MASLDESARPETKEKQEKDLALFPHLVAHIFPQCGQFARVSDDAFLAL